MCGRSMTDYLRLRLRQTLRSVAVTVPGRMLAFVVAGLLLAIAIQLLVLGHTTQGPVGSGTAPSERLQAEVGYAILLLAALSLATGAQSSRFPCTPADVAWVYSSPIPTGHIVAAQVIWQVARRCTFWLLGGVFVDIVGTVALDAPPGSFVVRAVLAIPLLVALVVLSVGAGTTRGSTAAGRTARVLGMTLAAAVLAPLLGALLAGSTPSQALGSAALSPLARSLGSVVFGRYDLVSGVALGATVLVGAALCRLGGAGLREQLTLDAAFWSDFSMTSMRPTDQGSKPSFRRLPGLTGPWSLLWFELCVLRRANYQRWSALILVVTSVLTGSFAPELLPLLAVVVPLGVVTGAYMSGVARHLRLRTLLMVPGGLPARVLAAEAVHVVVAGAGLVVGLSFGGLAGGYGLVALLTILFQGLVLLALAFATRIATSALAFRDGSLRGGLFHLTLALTLVAALSAVVATTWLIAKIEPPTGMALIATLGVATLLLAGSIRLLGRRTGLSANRESRTRAPALARQ